ncbi:MAG: N-acetylmuramoyl-L-alanine amidase [Flavobacteriales bacterium]
MNTTDLRSSRKTSTFYVSKHWLVLLLIVAAIIGTGANMPEPPIRKFTLVLDAGHGGSDPGNLGTGRKKRTEKDISLDVTLMVGKYIQEKYPEVEIVYTRKGDTFPTLNDRVTKANDAVADLFISIHCNANDNQNASGVETFVMGLHKSEESLKTAMRENASIYLEKDHEKNYSGFDPKNPDTYIILSMRENIFLGKSIDLAQRVQDQFRTRVGRKDRGVKQAGYYVISFTNMPSILVELGFLTNPDEEDFLHSEDGKTHMASSIFRAFEQYYQQYKGGTENVANDNPKRETRVESNNTQQVEYEQITSGVKFQVQIMSSPKPLDRKSKTFKGVTPVDEFLNNGVYKYLAGSTSIYEKAKDYQRILREQGFDGAFVVAFENGERIELSKAIELTSKR